MLRIVYLLIVCLNLIFFTTGCGGGGGGSSDSSKYVSGVAATGAPAANKIVLLADRNGLIRSTTSDANGNYSIEIVGLTSPYLIWFETDEKPLFATDCGSLWVNVNPFSDVVTRSVYQQAGGEGNPDAAMLPEGECAIIQNQIKEIIAPILALYGLDEETDFISQEDFSADTFGLDGIFDDYSMEITDEGNFVLASKIDEQPIVTVSVDELEAPEESIEDTDMTETLTLRMLNHIADETTFEDFGGDNRTASAVYLNLNLYTTTYNKVSASWASSNTTAVANDGTVTYPGSATDVTLTLTLSKNGFSVNKQFAITVTESDGMTDAEAVAADIAALDFDDFKNANTSASAVQTDLSLPSSGSNDTTITWSSNVEDVVASNGVVFRHITEDKTVTITATIAKGTENDTKSFDLTVPVVAVQGLDFMGYFTHALGGDGTLWQWGGNYTGQLGDSGSDNALEPNLMPSDFTKQSGLKSHTAGGDHSLAIKQDGTLWGWGENSYGELGNGTNDNALVPVQIGNDTDWEKVHSANYCSFAIKSDGTLWSWGRNDSGQLGLGDTTNYNTPQQIGSDTDWDYMSGKYTHFMGVKANEDAYIWGSNSSGQIGDGTTTDVTSPTAFGSISDWRSISLGLDHTIAVKPDSTLWAWGGNLSGQFGDGTTTSTTSETQVGADNDWYEVYAGNGYSFAVKTGGNIYSTGTNGSGQLGINSSTASFNTLQLFGTTTDWDLLYTGFRNVFGMKTDGTVWAWGDNSYGQLGDNSTTNRIEPVQVFPRP